ncbi:MAG TPA: PP2C family serine/threonine-protein phosphatase [Ktedonobacterales bacterium]|nr:PP2C family serine/threonine-protein phosphatase [Ktedonobacterales bacterium]
MPLHLKAAAKTDVGQQRDQNEDNCFAQVSENEGSASGIFIVADGMGGYHAGELASQIAVESISKQLKAALEPASAQPTVRLNKSKRGKGRGVRFLSRTGSKDDPNKTRPLAAEKPADSESAPAPAESGDAAESPDAAVTQQLTESLIVDHYAEQLRTAVEQGSEAIVEYGRQHSEARGLGSTLTAALVIGEQAFIANVGDSRTYLLRGGKLDRVTQDHSLVERLVQAGQIEPDDVYDHPNRNLIYRSLGASKAEVEVDIFTEKLKPGDALLLCSDGLWEMVHDPQIESILNEVEDPQAACDRLVERANEHGGEDNITAVLVRCVEV